MNQFDFSFIWKLITVIAAIAFLLVAIIPALMRKSILNILEAEVGVVVAWLVLLLIYGILMYLVRRTRRS
jgi:hypothetical protein